MRRSAIALGMLGVMMLGGTARAGQDDCAPGSVAKKEDGYSWCEPSVCANDTQCGPGMVCRPLGLCLEVGQIKDAKTPDASSRLMVTQVCAPDRACPHEQTCSVLSRCVAVAAAQRMGILGTPAASNTPGTASGDPPKKSSCGCSAVGSLRGALSGWLSAVIGIAGLGLLVGRRRRAR